MSRSDFLVLRNHGMFHFKDVKVPRSLIDRKFQSGCSIQNCDATCCAQGVLVDPVEKARILSHALLILKHMEPHQEKNPAKWFEGEEEIDSDFPSGRGEGTQTREYGCVFLKRNGHCVLQAAATAEGKHRFMLKPFFCIAYPITIHQGMVELEDLEYADRKSCCNADDTGALSAIEVLAAEFEFVLGAEGFEELKRLSSKS
ncbi:MAG: DUF3109 family protein [Ignavibacteria bacterium]|nr:DUF3109 family protein [Ignavibacteria bacterium]